MKRILSIKYSAGAFNFSMLLLRVLSGTFMLINHGYLKMMNFSEMQTRFYSFLGLGSRISLIMAIFAEVFCSLFIILGLFTRFAAVALVITMLVAIFGAGAAKPFLEMEQAFLYLGIFITLLFCGPGKLSIDGMINK